MKTIYSDTCVAIILGDPAGSKGRATEEHVRALQRAVAAKEIEFLLPPHVANELGVQLATRADRQQAFKLVWDLGAKRGVKEHAEIWADEARAVLEHHPMPDIFYPSGSDEQNAQLEAWREMADCPQQHLDVFRKHAGTTQPARVQIRNLLRARQADFREKLAALPAEYSNVPFEEFRALAAVRKRAREQYQHIATNYLHLKKASALRVYRRLRYAKSLRLSIDIITAWEHAAFFGKDDKGNPEEIQNSVHGDILHAVYAGRADLFVTSDSQMIRVFRRIPRKERCGVLHWTEFFQGLQGPRNPPEEW